MIAVVVPSNRPERLESFLSHWKDQFERYNVSIYIVRDGEKPTVNGLTVEEVMGEYSDLIYNFNDGVRNLGFAQAYKDGADIILSLDDDTRPCGDTIGDHLKALDQKVCITWMNTANEVYMRGFPYGIREESEVMLSHGVWEGVADFDASTQLVLGSPKLTYKQGVVPKGIYYPMCVMNICFKRKLMPYIYQAPAYDRYQRFSDIWSGIMSKRAIDENNWAVVTGYAKVIHDRASNPFVNLVKEAVGVGANEGFWKGDITGHEEYFKNYEEKRQRWQEFINQI
jgi:hypothetical protein